MKKSKAEGINAYKKIMEKEGPGLIKTGRSDVPKAPETPKASKYRRTAQFMLLIGSDESSKILSQLEPEQVEAISKELVSIKTISTEEAESVLEEFRNLLSPAYRYFGSSSGGPAQARRLLYAAFGPERGEAMLVKAVPDAAENPFDFLSDFSPEQLNLLFKDESPLACAMVFSRLPSKLSADILRNIGKERKLEIVKRIARINDISPEVIERVSAALKEKARHFGKDDTETEIDGMGVLTAILKHSETGFGSQLLEKLEEEDPFIGREMKARLYTLDDVCNASDKPIQEKLRTMDDREVALLLRGRSDDFCNKIYYNLSKGRTERVQEENEIMGPVPKIEIEAVTREFLAWFRLNLEDGRILLLTGEDIIT
ncbi:MAG: flagellar motor switch protein FliG [Treponema sp.]|nr:flagellar motor switch protein FliG [Treponema sp.]